MGNRAAFIALWIGVCSWSYGSDVPSCPFGGIAPQPKLWVESFNTSYEIALAQAHSPTLEKKQRTELALGLIRDTARLLDKAGWEVELAEHPDKGHPILKINRDGKKQGFDFFHHLDKYWDVQVYFDPIHDWADAKDRESLGEDYYYFEYSGPKSWIRLPHEEMVNLMEGNPTWEVLLHELVHAYTRRKFNENIMGALQGHWEAKGDFTLLTDELAYAREVSLDEIAAFSHDARYAWLHRDKIDSFRTRLEMLKEMHQQLTHLTQGLKKNLDQAEFKIREGGWDNALPDGSSPQVVRVSTSDYSFTFPVPRSWLKKTPKGKKKAAEGRRLTEEKLAQLETLLADIGKNLDVVSRSQYRDARLTLHALTDIDFACRNHIAFEMEAP